MSILIKGMEMPKDKEIILRIDEEGQVYNIYGEYPTKIYEAIEIPPHGDLIDKQVADELNKKDYEAMGSDRYTDYARSVVLNCLNAAPIIIESEGDE